MVYSSGKVVRMNYKIYRYWKQSDDQPLFYVIPETDVPCILTQEDALIFKLRHQDIKFWETEEPSNYPI